MSPDSTGFNLADLFEAVAAAVPDREAVVCGGRRLTYRQLDERADRLAAVLTARGLRTGEAVGLWLGNGTEYIEGMLAAFKVSAVPVNVNWRYGPAEIRHLFADARLAAVIHEPDLSSVLAQVRPPPADLRITLASGDEYERALAAAPPGRLDPGVRSGDDRYVIYTGGTTGAPKGVVWRQDDAFVAAFGGGNLGGPPVTRPEEVVARASAAGAGRCLPASPLVHAAAHWLAFATLFGGGTVLLCPGRGAGATAVLDLAAAEAATTLVVVGDAMVRPLVDALASRPGAWDLSALVAVVSGGATLAPATKEALVGLLPGVLVLDVVGASESGGHGYSVEGAGAVSPVTGRFRPNSQTAVLDAGLRPVAPGSGTVGRLARRDRVPVGYLGDPDASAATFPVVDGVRWALPGDLATVEADGTVLLLGRGSTVVNTGGEKVHPEEVEIVLRSHPDVADAVVVGVPDPRWGERVTAVVAPRPGTRPTLDALAGHCRHTLAAYKRPRGLVVVDEVVRSPAGKPDYRWARAVATRSRGAAG
jgi:acyl-CoA synthetase (AMP-forming)/AMP-acid ligase II